MNNNPPSQETVVICHCSGTTQAKIETLLANEVNTLEKIVEATGSTTGCGACDYIILELITRHGKSCRSE